MTEIQKPQISIIMPVYNAAKYLDESINSIINQSFENWELILVEDGSADDSPKICDYYAARDIRIKAIHKENEGVAIARMTGCEVASAEWVGFLDSDDTMNPACLEKCMDMLNKHDVDILVFGSVWHNEATGKEAMHCPKYKGYYDKDRIRREIFPELIQTERAEYYPQSIWCNIYKKNCLLPYMIADSRAVVGEDGACVIPAIYHADNMYFMEEPLYNYRVNTDSVTGGRRVFNWDNPEVTAKHIESNIDIENEDFKNQLDRRLCHDVFNVCVSRFYSGRSYKDIASEINKNLKRDLYYNAISNSRFRGSVKSSLMMFALKTRSVRLIELYSKLSK